jgi:hypothetical protein
VSADPIVEQARMWLGGDRVSGMPEEIATRFAHALIGLALEVDTGTAHLVAAREALALAQADRAKLTLRVQLKAALARAEMFERMYDRALARYMPRDT